MTANPDLLNLRRAMLRNGYKPVPILTGKKFPTMDAWEKVSADATPESVATWPASHGGTGVLCGNVVGLDIDVSDPALVDALELAAMDLLGLTPLRRVGRAPRVLLVYRAAEHGIRLMKTPKLQRQGEAEPWHVEVRATGQQFVAFGIHPDTGKPYSWSGVTPEDVPAIDLPGITADDLRAYLTEAERILRAGGCDGVARGVQGGPGAGVARATADLAPPDAAAAVALLDSLPNPLETDRATWVAVMTGAKGCIDGLAAAGALSEEEEEAIREAAIRWACRWPASRGYEVESDKWDGDWSRRDAPLAGWPSLLRHAAGMGADTAPAKAATAAAEFAAAPVPEPAAPADPEAWRSMLLTTEEGNARACSANALTAFRHAPEWRGVLAFNEFASQVTFLRAPPWAAAGPWTPRQVKDVDFVLGAEWLQRQGIHIGGAHVVAETMAAVAAEQGFHPVRDFLRGLRWDGVRRCDTWLCNFLGANDTPLNRAFAAKFLLSAVARVTRPGCQVDTVLVLEGPQGLRKSTALRTLAGGEWFTDHIPDLHTKDAALQIQGVWILEHAEMANLNRVDAGKAKAFISLPVDRFRPPFGKVSDFFPRQCVFAATVNPGGSGYLRDETGARRFWPVLCGIGWEAGQKVDTAALAAVRGQLWAEAVARFDAGESWWLETAELEQAQADAAEERFDSDDWTDPVAEAVTALVADRPFVRVPEILGRMGVATKDQTRGTQMRIAAILHALGWRRKTQRIDGKPAKIFVAPGLYVTSGQVVTLGGNGQPVENLAQLLQ